MGRLIDSSVIIAVERGQVSERAIASGEDIAIAAITASELLHGVHRADSEDRRARREAFVESILAAVPILTFDLVVARVHSRVGAQLARAGVSVGAHDLIIGATALAFGLIVLTRDARSFPKIPGLQHLSPPGMEPVVVGSPR